MTKATKHAFHFNGGTLKPVAYDTDENYKYFPRYQSAYVGEKGVIVDLSDWAIDGRTDWYRFSCMASFDHDPACSTDGGITVRGTQDGKALFYFGGTFSGSTLNGGVTVEAGGKISAEEQALAGVSVTLLPGSIYKAYSKSYSVAIQSLTAGSENGTEPVALQTGTFASGPALVVEELSVLSPVEFSTAGYKTGEAVWNNEAAANPGVYTALVYRTASPALDPSLFRLPAEYAGDYSLSAATVSLTEGDYAGYTALVFDIAEVVHDNLTLTNSDVVTISFAVDYDNIYVGDFEIVGEPVLTLADGADVHAKDFHLAYQPADVTTSGAAGKHTVSYVQNGGALTVDAIYSMFLGEDVAGGRANAGFTLNGGSLDVLGDVMFGYNQTRSGYMTTLTVNGGTMTVGGEMLLTRYNNSTNAPQGILMMNGGALSVMKDIDLSCGKNSSSLYAVDGGVFLRGGVLSARNIKQSSASCTVQRLVFDGGVYAPNAAAAGRTLSGLAKAHVSTNGAIISTEKLPADGTYTIAQKLLKDPGLNGAADGGFTKRGTGTLALTGANTFTGPTRVEGGTLAVSSADAISDDVTVADGAALDLGGSSVTLSRVAASGVIENGSLSVSGSVVTAAEGLFLNVGGDLTLVPGMVVDFAGSDAGWRPLAAASGTVAAPPLLRARNVGGLNRCKTSVIDGVLYVCPTTVGFMFSVK